LARYGLAMRDVNDAHAFATIVADRRTLDRDQRVRLELG
jgi:hypothetical protein